MGSVRRFVGQGALARARETYGVRRLRSTQRSGRLGDFAQARRHVEDGIALSEQTRDLAAVIDLALEKV